MEPVVSLLALFALGLTLRTTSNLIYGARGPSAGDYLHGTLELLTWCLITAPLAVLAVSFAAAGLPLLIIFAQAAIESTVARRARHRRSAWALAQLPELLASESPQSVAMLAQPLRGRTARRFTRFADDLRRGIAWPEAVQRHARAFPRIAPLLAFVHSKTATSASPQKTSEGSPLSNATSAPQTPAEATYADPWLVESNRQFGERMSYFIVTMGIGVGLIAFSLWKIMPSFREIMAEHTMPVPGVTSAFVTFAEVAGPLILFFFGAAVLLAVLVGALALFDVPWFWQMLDRLAKAQHAKEAIDVVCTAMERRLPIVDALHWISFPESGHYAAHARRSAARAYRAMVAGTPWPEALAQAGFVSTSDAAALHSAEIAGNATATLRRVGERRLRVATIRRFYLQQFATAAGTLLLAVLVAWYAIAMIYPLSTLVQEVA
ncbi:MAG: type II secretion system F family protein [Planctomycetales bacterium]|nr:type II secretion system F family protein [Planctomycetales bacterium]